MDNLLWLSIGCFTIAALIGLSLFLIYVLPQKETPKGVVMIHGGFAALGLVSLIVYCIYFKVILLALILFILAALGGFFMVYLDVVKHQLPRLLVLIHGLIAVSGFIALLWFVVSRV